MRLTIVGLLTALFFLPSEIRASGPGLLVIAQESGAAPQARLAAKEVARYVYLRTGALPEIAAKAPDNGDAIVFTNDAMLDVEAFAIKTVSKDGRRVWTISGGSPLGELYGAYRFVEKLGVRFYLHGDTIPDEQIAALPDMNENGAPIFAVRGVLPFHDFPEGPDWWNRDDYLACIAQIAKMRMNFIGMHCYPPGDVGPEPLVWIGEKSDCDEQGRVKFSYPAFWASTARTGAGYTPTKTSDFAAGASLLFADDVYGNNAQAGLMPRPKTTSECDEVFNRTGVMMRDVFARAKKLGVKTCIGTETPLTIPPALREHLKSLGKNPADPVVIGELYQGIFARIARACPVDYYWLWTPEPWRSGNTWKQFEDTKRDIQTALDALKSLGEPFQLATSGWLLGPQQDRAAFDAFLPKNAPMSAINEQLGYDPVEPLFARITDRPKWAIPWMENDLMLTQPEPWVARMRYDAADAKRLGCSGLIGLHWRTKAMMQNVSALAASAWDQSWCPKSFAKPVKTEMGDGALGGDTAGFTSPVKNTEEPRIYQTVRYNADGYNLTVPNGTYSVTLKFNEPTYDSAGKRVFGVKIQDRQVIDILDIFAKVGKNKALDYTFDKIEVTNGFARIDFTRQVEFPCIAGIVISGTTKPFNQIAGQPFTRKINCGGAQYKDYEADRVSSAVTSAGQDRGMPIADFYTDFCRANFGGTIANEAGAIMASIDGMKMPKVTDWGSGPGAILVNSSSWEDAKNQFAFVETFEKLRPQVRGAGNLERFDYWLNTYRAAESIAHLGCMRGDLDRVVNAMKNESGAEKKRALATNALGIRVNMARAWEKLISYQISACDTPGEMGTIANLEMQSRRTEHLLDKHDKDIADALGAPLPKDATPSADFAGAPRIIVPTVREQADPGESLKLKVIVMDSQPPKNVTLFWRPLGKSRFKKAAVKHVARAVYSASLPGAKEDLEYYIYAETSGGLKLVWPATAPTINQTVVVTE